MLLHIRPPTSIGSHAVIGDMEDHCVGLIALWIEGIPRPARGAGRGDVESKPIADLLAGDAAPDPSVESANLVAAAFNPDMGLAIAARPVPQKRRIAGECRARRSDQQEHCCQSGSSYDHRANSTDCPSRKSLTNNRVEGRKGSERRALIEVQGAFGGGPNSPTNERKDNRREKKWRSDHHPRRQGGDVCEGNLPRGGSFVLRSDNHRRGSWTRNTSRAQPTRRRAP
jgi:hypothetical protein